MKQFYFFRLMILAVILLVWNGSLFAQTTTYSYTGTVATYLVPAGVTSLSITATGAQGGSNLSPLIIGGHGATMSGVITVVPGHTLNIIVGQQPAIVSQNNGGGGGSFVWDASATTLPLIAAGGGGGASSAAAGIDASLTNSGTDGGGGTTYGGAGLGGDGGIMPSSGSAGTITYGAAGGGWFTNGAAGSSGSVVILPLAGGGHTPLSGGAGGVAGGTTGIAGAGGFGGGGGGESPTSSVTTATSGGGGGGGYSGGGGGASGPGTTAKSGGGGGSYCLTLSSSSVTNTGNGTVTITVLCSPGPITGNYALCIGSSETVICTPSGGTWVSAHPTIATITGGGSVTGVGAGLDTILYIVASGCGTTDTAIATVLVNPPASAGTISGSLTVCVGATTTLTETLTGGAWSASNTNATVGTTGIVTGVTAGTDIITYTNSCGGAHTTATVTINPLPNAGTITGASLSVCIGATITLTDGSAGGTWSASNTDATVAGGVVTGVVAGTDSIKYSVTNSCGTATTGVRVTINPLPAAGTISGSVNVCVGSTIILTDATGGGTWSATNGHATVAGGSVAGVSAGVDTIEYTVTNSCGSATATYAVTVNAVATAGTISGPSSVCMGATATLTDATGGGTWSVSNADATVSGGMVTGVAAGVDTINYSVTNGCGTVATTAVVTVNLAPSAGTITGIDSVCIGSHVSLTDPVTGGVWGSTSAKATVTVSGVVTGVSAGMDTINYKVSNALCTSTAMLPVLVKSCRVGVEDISIDDQLNVYPNPAMDELNIENAGTGTTVKLFSIAGRQVYSGVISSDKQTINIQNLVPGAYILQLTDNAGNRTTRMVMKQ